MLTEEERQARYARMQARLEKKARLKKMKRDAMWNTKLVDSSPTAE